MSTLFFITEVHRCNNPHRTMGIRVGVSTRSKWLKGVMNWVDENSISYAERLPKSPSDTMIKLSKKSIT